VKQIQLTMIAGLLMIQALATYGLSSEDQAIAERIKPVGEVCIEGQSCLETPAPVAEPAPQPSTAPAPQSSTAPEPAVGSTESDVVESNAAVAESYTKTCAICHATGLAEAPKFGSVEDWLPRIAKGKETLYQSSINGMPPAMPAKGMCFSCSDDDLKALVDYMVENSQ